MVPIYIILLFPRKPYSIQSFPSIEHRIYLILRTPLLRRITKTTCNDQTKIRIIPNKQKRREIREGKKKSVFKTSPTDLQLCKKKKKLKPTFLIRRPPIDSALSQEDCFQILPFARIFQNSAISRFRFHCFPTDKRG